MPAPNDILLEQALVHHRAGRLAEAERKYAQARLRTPRSFDALHLSGVLAYQQKRYIDAVSLLSQALRLDAKSALCSMRLGLAKAGTGDVVGAEKLLRAAVALDAKLPDGWTRLALALRDLGQMEKALAAAEQAVRVEPNSIDAQECCAALRAATRGMTAALPNYRQVAALAPERAQSWSQLGAALAQCGLTDESLECFSRALSIDPSSELAHHGRALAWQSQHRIAEAVAEYEVVLARNPDNHEARSSRLLCLHYIHGVARETILEEHVAFGRQVGTPPARTFINTRDPDRKLRVAFLSPDLRAHSVAFFLEPLLAHLDRDAFEVCLYHDHPHMDATSERLRLAANSWTHLAGQRPASVEAKILTDAPDVLVDLAGHTGHNRLPLLARRVAPVQLTYLGYPDTTGVTAMDGRLTDNIADPAGDADAFSTERLYRFAPTAWCYIPPAGAPPVAPPPSSHRGFVTFGCFNNFSKASDATLLVWARLLLAVRGSRLLLKSTGLDTPLARAQLEARLAKLGVAEVATRVELAGRTNDIPSHLACYERVDIALDTFPYHGTTTTCEALWMGRPVVTLAGDRHASRVGASLLSAIGHAEWIATDPEKYIDIARSLAGDLLQRETLGASLRDQLGRSPLLDHSGQALRFGAALRQAWGDFCRGSALA